MCIGGKDEASAARTQQVWSLLDRPLSWKQVSGAALTGARRGLVLGVTVVAVVACVLLILRGALRDRFARWREAHVSYDLGGFLHWWYAGRAAGPTTDIEKRDRLVQHTRYAMMCVAYPSSLATQLIKVLPSHTQGTLPTCLQDMTAYQQGLCSCIRVQLAKKSSSQAAARPSGAAISADSASLEDVVDALKDCGDECGRLVVVTAASDPPPWWGRGEEQLRRLGWVTNLCTSQSQDDEFLLLMGCEALVLCDSAFHIACAAANSGAQVRTLTERTSLVQQVAPLWKLWPCSAHVLDVASNP